ncbi:MAG: hypothetical protein R3337_14540, partial [Gammaproteobacteria bacterium]|nr:hypothetical protein [Gammaproteobacteria bacterium]
EPLAEGDIVPGGTIGVYRHICVRAVRSGVLAETFVADAPPPGQNDGGSQLGGALIVRTPAYSITLLAGCELDPDKRPAEDAPPEEMTAAGYSGWVIVELPDQIYAGRWCYRSALLYPKFLEILPSHKYEFPTVCFNVVEELEG